MVFTKKLFKFFIYATNARIITNVFVQKGFYSCQLVQLVANKTINDKW